MCSSSSRESCSIYTFWQCLIGSNVFISLSSDIQCVHFSDIWQAAFSNSRSFLFFFFGFCRFRQNLVPCWTGVWQDLESQINVKLLWTGHLLHCFSGTWPLATGCSVARKFFILLHLTGMLQGLESQINVKLLWTGHLLHRSSVTLPLYRGSTWQHALHRLVRDCSTGNWVCKSVWFFIGLPE